MSALTYEHAEWGSNKAASYKHPVDLIGKTWLPGGHSEKKNHSERKMHSKTKSTDPPHVCSYINVSFCSVKDMKLWVTIGTEELL